MRKLLSVALVLMVVLGVFAFPVNAGLRFCSNDPIFDVDGHEVSVLIELAPYEVKDAISPEKPVVTVLYAPKGTDPKVVSVFGDFPEYAEAREWGRDDKLGIRIKVPKVEGYEMMRVTVFIDGEEVAQKMTEKRNMFLVLDWDEEEHEEEHDD